MHLNFIHIYLKLIKTHIFFFFSFFLKLIFSNIASEENIPFFKTVRVDLPVLAVGIQKFFVAGLKKGREEMSHILTQANSLAYVLLIPCPPSFLVALAVIPSLLNANLKHLEWAWQQG